MPQMNIFRWRAGRGWLVLTGGGAPESDENVSIAAHALARTHSQGPIAYIWAASDIERADAHMDLLRDLGARTGYLIDVLSESDDELVTQLQAAGVIILGDGPRIDMLRDALVGSALDAVTGAFQRGATVYALGRSAAVLGAQMQLDTGHHAVGFNWLAGALVMADYDPDQTEPLRAWLQEQPQAFGLGLSPGSALALGPGGQVELWGNTAVTVLLGQDYNPGVTFEGDV